MIPEFAHSYRIACFIFFKQLLRKNVDLKSSISDEAVSYIETARNISCWLPCLGPILVYVINSKTHVAAMVELVSRPSLYFVTRDKVATEPCPMPPPIPSNQYYYTR